MRNNKGYRSLITWQKSNKLAHLVYDYSVAFPKEESFNLTSQVRRAALSVCANIAEGYSRGTHKDRKHFYQIAAGSLTELEFFIDFAHERKYITDTNFKKLLEQHSESAKVLSGLIKST